MHGSKPLWAAAAPIAAARAKERGANFMAGWRTRRGERNVNEWTSAKRS